MRRARRKRLDYNKLELKTQQIAAHIYETLVCAYFNKMKDANE